MRDWIYWEARSLPLFLSRDDRRRLRCVLLFTTLLVVAAAAQSPSHEQSREQIIAQARELLESGKAPEAGRAAAAGLQSFPNDPKLLHLRGLAYFRIGNVPAAEQDVS